MTLSDELTFRPGPWRLTPIPKSADVCICADPMSDDDDVHEIAVVLGDAGWRDGNAALIAAAPDLFQILDTILFEIDADGVTAVTARKAVELLRRIERGDA